MTFFVLGRKLMVDSHSQGVTQVIGPGPNHAATPNEGVCLYVFYTVSLKYHKCQKMIVLIVMANVMKYGT